jgi:hypothetical protein
LQQLCTKKLGRLGILVGDLLKTAFIDGGLDPTSKNARQNAWKDFDPTASWSPCWRGFVIRAKTE